MSQTNDTEAQRERLNHGLRTLASWCASRAMLDHDTETTLTMLENKAAELRDTRRAIDESASCGAASALATKWGKQAEMLLAQKKDFADRGYSSSLIQLWDTVAGVLNDCKTELEEAISSHNATLAYPTGMRAPLRKHAKHAIHLPT